jgi:hypothetical protein
VTAARSGRSFLVLVATAVGLLVLYGAGRAGSATTKSTVGALRVCGGCTASGGNLSRYRYVILNASDAPLLPALKAANPGLKALVYKNLSFTASYYSCGVDPRYLTTGVGYCDANASHPDWFLTDTTGARINSAGFPQAWLMDVGDPAYEDTWSSNVLAELRADGWDGVFMDDTDASMGWHLDGRRIDKYPSGAEWRTATRDMLSRVGPSITSAGFLAVPNLYAPWAADYDAPTLWRDWLRFTSGAAQEYYTKWGTASSGWFAGNDWTYRQQFQSLTEQAGKIFLGITYAPKSDVRSMTYARANFLLFDEPAYGGSLIFEPSDPEAQDPYASPWTADIGAPSGARFQVGAAWRRNYSVGTVLVNPSTSAVTVKLERPYLQDDGKSTRSVTLGPTSGAILRSSGSGPPPPRPPGILLTATVAQTSVRLSWAGTTSAQADVFRNARRVATVANPGSYTDRVSKTARGTFTYRVCAAGTSTCSADLPVQLRPAGGRAAHRSPKARRSMMLRKRLRARARARRAAAHTGRSRAASR